MKENLNQLDDIFKLLMNTHQQHSDLIPDEAKHADSQWFNDIYKRMLSFKHQKYNWISENEDDKKSNSVSKLRSWRSSKHSSKSGKSSSLSKSSSKERAIKEKLRMGELIAEAWFMEKKHSSRNGAEKLELEGKVAKSRAKAMMLKGHHHLEV